MTALAAWAILGTATPARAQRTFASSDLPSGQSIAKVVCLDDAIQSYALYLPSGYAPNRAWPVIYAFDPAGRGLNPIDRYQAAAEKYGYIVAGSNNSRNGPWTVIEAAVSAMTKDVASRFRIDPRRTYAAGMSGGSRAALALGLSVPDMAGVMASSAGYADGKRRKELPFAVFETAGTEDFNYSEMREIDRDLTTPHLLAVFEGGHIWLSPELAMDAVEWMELQAMKSGRKPRDQAEADAIYATRVARVATDQVDQDSWLATKAIAEDFAGLKDVSQFTAKATVMGKDKRVRDAIRTDLKRDDEERQTRQAIQVAVASLANSNQHADALKQLSQRAKTLSETAAGPTDTPERRMARRVLSEMLMNGSTTKDAEYGAILKQYRMARPGR